MKHSFIHITPRLIFLILAGCLLFTPSLSQTQSKNVKALVGGTLIDGYGSTPHSQQRRDHRRRANQGGGPGWNARHSRRARK